MTREIRSPNVENSQLYGRRFRHSDFVIPSDFVIRHSDLRIAVWSIKRPVSGLVRAAGSGSAHGAPPFVFSACIGTMNPLPTPPRRGTDTTWTNARSPPWRGRGWVGSWRASNRFFASIRPMNFPGQFFVAYATKNCPGMLRGTPAAASGALRWTPLQRAFEDFTQLLRSEFNRIGLHAASLQGRRDNPRRVVGGDSITME